MVKPNSSSIIFDVTCAPSDIAFSTDVSTGKHTETMIDELYAKKKPSLQQNGSSLHHKEVRILNHKSEKA